MSDLEEIGGNVFGRWDIVAPGIHEAVFALPRGKTFAGRVGAEAERMFNAASEHHRQGVDSGLWSKAVIAGLTVVEEAFRRATYGEFSEQVFKNRIIQGLAEAIGEAQVYEEKGIYPGYVSQLEDACGILIELARGQVGGRLDEMIKKERQATLDDMS